MKSLKKTVVALVTVLLFPVVALSQNTLSGTVKNAEDGRRMGGANIFLDGTTIGARADKYGNFSLKNIPDGVYTIVISYVGFQTFVKQLTLPLKERSSIHANQFNVTLKPKTLHLKNTIVKGDNRQWQKQLKKFRKYFLGFTKNAAKTRILNQEVLQFKHKNGKFIAYANKPIQFKNNALGYKVTVYLQKFTYHNDTYYFNGNLKFTKLSPANSQQQEFWEIERRRAYYGSFRDFINALVAGNLLQAGFKVQFTNNIRPPKRKISPNSRTNVSNPQRLIKPLTRKRVMLSFYKPAKYLRVYYFKEAPERSVASKANYALRPPQISYIQLQLGKAIIDMRSAMEIAPYRALLMGYWGFTSHLPDLLPSNYQPGHPISYGNNR